MTKKENNVQVVKNSNDLTQEEKVWSNKTFTTDTMVKILTKTFGDEAEIGTRYGMVTVTFKYAVIEIADCFRGKWIVSNISSTLKNLESGGYDKETGKSVALFMAKNLTDVANFLDNANWILDQYKSAESTGDIASMFKYHKTLLGWGLTQDEINDFNWFNNSYKYFENK